MEELAAKLETKSHNIAAVRASAKGAREQSDEAKIQADQFIDAAKSVHDRQPTILVAATNAIIHSVTAQLIKARLDPEGAMDALRTKSQEYTRSLRDAYQKLQESARGAKEKAEGAEKAANEKRMISVIQANVLQQQIQLMSTTQRNGDFERQKSAAETTADAAGTAAQQAKEIKRNIDEIVSNAAKVLEIVNLKSTCASAS